MGLLFRVLQGFRLGFGVLEGSFGLLKSSCKGCLIEDTGDCRGFLLGFRVIGLGGLVIKASMVVGQIRLAGMLPGFLGLRLWLPTVLGFSGFRVSGFGFRVTREELSQVLLLPERRLARYPLSTWTETRCCVQKGDFRVWDLGSSLN